MAALLAILLSSCTGSEPRPSREESPRGTATSERRAERITGWLRAQGSMLVDDQGRAVRLLGVALRDLSLGSGDPALDCLGWSVPPDQAFDNILAWGFNSVRLAVSWANFEPRPPVTRPAGEVVHRYNMPYVRAVDRTIHEITSRGIAVILDMTQNKWSPAFHRAPGSKCVGNGMPAWLYRETGIEDIPEAKQAFFDDVDGVQQGYADVWRFVAGRYARNHLVVAADMMNEPYVRPSRFGPKDIHLGVLYESVGKAIRAVNRKILLIFQDSQDLGTGEFALGEPPPFRGVVYSFHLYTLSWEPGGLERTSTFESRADRWNVPLFVGEFNGFGYGSRGPVGPTWREDLTSLMEYCRERDISWNFWAYSGANSLIVEDGQRPKPGLLPLLQSGF